MFNKESFAVFKRAICRSYSVHKLSLAFTYPVSCNMLVISPMRPVARRLGRFGKDDPEWKRLRSCTSMMTKRLCRRLRTGFDACELFAI